MRLIIFIILNTLALNLFFSPLAFSQLKEEKSEAQVGDWFTNYYKKPTPEKLLGELEKLHKKGILKNADSTPTFISFISQIMITNPKMVPQWLEKAKSLSKDQKDTLYMAAWISRTLEAKDFFTKNNLSDFQQKAPDLLSLEVQHPSTLDMFWGAFFATGKQEPIRSIIKSFELSKYTGAIERFKNGDKSEKANSELLLEATFQSATWSLESNCHQHPKVLEHCIKIHSDPKLTDIQRLWLTIVLAKVKPEQFSIEFNEDKDK